MTDSVFLNVVLVQSLQLLLFAGVVALIASTVARRRPNLAYMLWMLVLVKAVTPPIGAGFSIWNLLPQSLNTPISTAAENDAAEDTTAVAPTSKTAQQPTATRRNEEPRTATSAATAFPISSLLLAVWGIGVVVLTIVAVRASRRIGRIIRQSRGAAEPRLQAAVSDMSAELCIPYMTDSAIIDESVGPAIRGFLKPQLLIPRTVFDSCSDEQLRLIVMHELMHVRRHDVLAGYYQTVVQILWWFHPAVWFAGRSCSLERERCCDDAVLNASQSSSDVYAQCLLDTARSNAKPLWAPCVVGLSGVKAIQRRMRHIMDGARRRTPTWLVVGVTATIAMLILPGAIQPSRELDERFQNGPLLPEGVTELPIQEPKILAMTWQKGNEGSGKHSDVPMWTTDGEELSKEEAAAIRAEIRGTETNWWNPGEASRPLVFVMDPGTQLAAGTTGVQIISWSNGRELAKLGGWMVREPGKVTAENMFTITASNGSNPRMSTPTKWVESIDVEMKFPIEEPVLLKTLTEVPTDTITIAEGVTWSVDPQAGYDPRAPRTGGQPKRFSAAVFKSLRDESTDLVTHSVRVYTKGSDQPLKGSHTTLEGNPRNGPIYEVRVSREFPSADEFDRIEIYRQRFARSLLKDVKVRIDLMP